MGFYGAIQIYIVSFFVEKPFTKVVYLLHQHLRMNI